LLIVGWRRKVRSAKPNSSLVRRPAVRDLIFVALIVAFFAASLGLVWLCERIVGAEEAVAVDLPTTTEPTEMAA
jgi:hypothetical protein